MKEGRQETPHSQRATHDRTRHGVGLMKIHGLLFDGIEPAFRAFEKSGCSQILMIIHMEHSDVRMIRVLSQPLTPTLECPSIIQR
ncbi:hypothetical protein D3C72_1942470 [compost metagenome]